MCNSHPREESELFEPKMGDVIHVARHLPDDELEQIRQFCGYEPLPEQLGQWFMRTDFKVGFRADRPLAVCGFTPIIPGVYRTFFMATERAWSEYGRELTEVTRSGMIDTINACKIRRLETLCLASRKRAQAWYRVLGLRYESTLKNYASDGSDAVMYVRTKECAEDPTK